MSLELHLRHPLCTFCDTFLLGTSLRLAVDKKIKPRQPCKSGKYSCTHAVLELDSEEALSLSLCLSLARSPALSLARARALSLFRARPLSHRSIDAGQDSGQHSSSHSARSMRCQTFRTALYPCSLDMQGSRHVAQSLQSAPACALAEGNISRQVRGACRVTCTRSCRVTCKRSCRVTCTRSIMIHPRAANCVSSRDLRLPRPCAAPQSQQLLTAN